MATSHLRSKSRDRSTPWSAWTWDPRGYYFSSRYGPTGEIEYDYRYPDSGLDQAIPRTPTDGTYDYSWASSSVPAFITSAAETASFYPADATASRYATSVLLSSEDSANEKSADLTTVGAPQYIRGNETAKSEGLDGEFYTIEQPSRFFKIGRVFKVLWTEPAGNVSDDEGPFVTASKFGQKAYTKVRRFVVVREMHDCCLCLPLYTHNGQGTLKFGVKSEDYAAVYPMGDEPKTKPEEVLDKNSFPIIVENAAETIDPMSRLNFGRVYTIEHNVKVLKVGRIPDEYLALLDDYFVQTVAGPQRNASTPLKSSLTTIAPAPQSYGYYGPSNSSTPATERYGPSTSSYGLSTSNLSASFASITADLGDLRFEKDSDSIFDSAFNPVPLATKRIRRAPGGGDYEELDRRYKIVESKNQRKFWRIGRVFMMLWTEPSGARLDTPLGGTRDGSHCSVTYMGGTAYSEIRRFVVIGDGHGSCICLVIHTYSGQGTLKSNLPDPHNHAIIYTSKDPPPELSNTDNDGNVVIEDLTIDPIRVTSEQSGPEGVLHPASRINFSKIYTVEKNVRVLNIGMVHANSMEQLLNCSPLKPVRPRPERPREKKKRR